MTNNTKPEVEFPEGPAPAELVIEDIEVGQGPEATPGASTVTRRYCSSASPNWLRKK